MRAHHLAYGLAAALVLAGAASAHGTGRPLHADLTGAAEVPGPGDPDGSGSATITVNPGTAEVCWELKTDNIAAATMAHIHQAPVGQAGGVTVALTPPGDGSSSGCKTVDQEQAAALFENPEGFYVNVHNAEHPSGALRGQLSARKLK